MKSVSAIDAQVLQDSRDIARAERADRDCLHRVLELLDGRLADLVNGIGREGKADRRANARQVAVGAVRVVRHPDRRSSAPEILVGQKLAITPHRRHDVRLEDARQLGPKLRGGVTPRRVIEWRLFGRRREEDVELLQRDLDVVPRGRVATPQTLTVVRRLGLDVRRHGVPARQRLAACLIGPHALQRRQ